MKYLFTFLLFVLCVNLYAGETEKLPKTVTLAEFEELKIESQKEIKGLKEEWKYRVDLIQDEHDKQISELKEWEIRFQNRLAIIIGVASLFLIFLTFFLDKVYASKIEGSVYKKLAKKVNGDKEALIKALEHRSTEIEIMSYSITVLAESFDKDSEGFKLVKLLRDYHFDNVGKSEYSTFIDKMDSYSYKNPNVIVLTNIKNKKDKKGSDDDIQKIVDKSPELGIIGFWKNKEGEIKLEGDTTLYANSYSKLYENLMSLLHYMRYKKKINSKK